MLVDWALSKKLCQSTLGTHEFIVPRNVAISERQTLLLPRLFSHIALSEMVCGQNSAENIPVFRQQDDDFLSLVHVALKLRSDIMSHPAFEGCDVSEEAELASIPPSVHMFVNILLGGQSGVDAEFDECETSEISWVKKTRVLGIGQDMVYGVCGDKKAPPKHVGMGMTPHQSTRSKKLVELFHNAGHIISYNRVLKYDTSMAENTLKALDPQTGAVVPSNLVSGRFVYFSGDNIDINDSTLDGKNTFHATQFAAWQRGPPAESGLRDIKPSNTSTLDIPPSVEKIHEVFINKDTLIPDFDGVETGWFLREKDTPSALQDSVDWDMAFLTSRQGEDEKGSWTTFNQLHSTRSEIAKTTIGYMPIILAPAHELSTLNTMVRRALHVARALGNRYAVITVDQALYPQLMELKWSVSDFRDTLIPRLGGLHITMNFLKAIGQHTEDSGILELWVESGLLGPNSAEKAKDGKSYAKAMRAHKLTWQAQWQILMPQFKTDLHKQDPKTCQTLEDARASKDFDSLLDIVGSETFRQHLTVFVENRQSDPNFRFWWDYLRMVTVLLAFVRAQRAGLWTLHLESFREMLPFFFRYDHVNYARWGCVYLSQMHQLPPEVEEEFRLGNFVVKGSDQSFNQVDPDHSLEWLNGIGKKSGGIIGITKTNSALARWTLSFNHRTRISMQTYEMMNVGVDTGYTPNEATSSRTKRDNSDEERILQTLLRFKVFAEESTGRPNKLLNCATKDVVTSEIEESLLNAETLGQQKLESFVKERLVSSTNLFHSALQKVKAPTFATLYDVATKTPSGKTESTKADRNFLQRLIAAYRAGRPVDLARILNHELMNVPISIAETSGELRSGIKANLFDILIQSVTCPTEISNDEPSCLIIDGQAAVMSLGKPSKANTFGYYADEFVKFIFRQGQAYSRIDVTFDRYRDISIKVGTRTKRTKKSRPVRRLIEDRDVPLPNKWPDFLASTENKTELAQFLSNALIAAAPPEKVVVVGGGFASETEVQSSDPAMDTTLLESNHEEADSRMILHCLQTDAPNIVVVARDTDVLVLLVANFGRMSCTRLWMKAGTMKKPKYVPVHDIRRELGLADHVYEILPAFHSVTGCDTVSFFSGHSKRTEWDIFLEHNSLLKDLGKFPTPSKQVTEDAEKFICHIYKAPSENCNQARIKLFSKCHATETLPPSSDAAKFHIERANYQGFIWREAHNPMPSLPPPTECGWRLVDGKLSPVLKTLPPIQKGCRELMQCSCTKGCSTNSCSCRKWGSQLCTDACKCNVAEIPCRNRAK